MLYSSKRKKVIIDKYKTKDKKDRLYAMKIIKKKDIVKKKLE